jgi:pentatricopeptide repeat protein
MDEHGLEPNVVTFTALLKGLTTVGDMAAAERLMERMAGAGAGALNLRSVNTMLRGCVRMGEVRLAGEVLRRMEGEWGVAPDGVSLEYALRLLSQGQRFAPPHPARLQSRRRASAGDTGGTPLAPRGAGGRQAGRGGGGDAARDGGGALVLRSGICQPRAGRGACGARRARRGRARRVRDCRRACGLGRGSRGPLPWGKGSKGREVQERGALPGAPAVAPAARDRAPAPLPAPTGRAG